MNKFEITNSEIEDIDNIIRLYDLAASLQEQKGVVSWRGIKRSLIEKEITEKRQWKMLIGNKTACIWAATYSDPQIWEKKNRDPSIYIHRITSDPEFKGQRLVLNIVEWAKKHALENEKQFIRMDTAGFNTKLIEHYTGCGFTYLGDVVLKNTDGLPAHYYNSAISLFELAL